MGRDSAGSASTEWTNRTWSSYGDQPSGKGAYSRSNTSSSKGKGKATHGKHNDIGIKRASEQHHASTKKGNGKTAHMKEMGYSEERKDAGENHPDLSRKIMDNANAIQ